MTNITLHVDLGLHVASDRELSDIVSSFPGDFTVVDKRKNATYNNIDPMYITIATSIAAGVSVNLLTDAFKHLLKLATEVRRPESESRPQGITIVASEGQSIEVLFSDGELEIETKAKKIMNHLRG